jgi:hypothetical protein
MGKKEATKLIKKLDKHLERYWRMKKAFKKFNSKDGLKYTFVQELQLAKQRLERMERDDEYDEGFIKVISLSLQ